MLIYGIDTGLSTFWSSRVQLYQDREEVVSVETFLTKKDNRKQARVCDDNARRCQELAGFLLSKINADMRVVALCVEAMSWPRNAVAIRMIAMCWGVICSMSELFKIPVIQISPVEVKKRLTGRKDSSKEDVRSAIEKLYPETVKMWNKAKTRIEHESDATGAAIASLDHEVILAVRRASFHRSGPQMVIPNA